jgi:hypothetical protein
LEEAIDMRKRWLLLLLVGAALGVSVGCSRSNGLSPVTGKAIYKGQPAEGALLYFVREGKADPLHKETPTAIVQADGTFQVASGELGDGVPPGDYAVLVQWPTASAAGTGRGKLAPRNVPGGIDRLKGRYFHGAAPLLRATVKPGSNELPTIELKD